MVKISEPDNIQLFIKAIEFAAHKHRNQRRKNIEATPYINHPIALASVLANEGQIAEINVLCAALLHDTIEDTETTENELRLVFGETICGIVIELTDNKSLPKSERKRLQIEHANHVSHSAKLVKLADKICNLRDIISSPPADWSPERKKEYFNWTLQVVDKLRGTHQGLERLFDVVFSDGQTLFKG